MLIPDINLLVYAVNEEDHHHEVAKRWVDNALGAGEAVGFAWLALIGFIRLTTLAGVVPRPFAVADAFRVLDVWFSSPVAIVVEPTPRHLTILHDLLAHTGAAGNLTNDAHLAALAIEHRGEICTFDRDFNRFPGVRVRVPS